MTPQEMNAKAAIWSLVALGNTAQSARQHYDVVGDRMGLGDHAEIGSAPSAPVGAG